MQDLDAVFFLDVLHAVLDELDVGVEVILPLLGDFLGIGAEHLGRDPDVLAQAVVVLECDVDGCQALLAGGLGDVLVGCEHDVGLQAERFLVVDLAGASAHDERLDVLQARIDDIRPRAFLEDLGGSDQLVGGTEHHDDLVVGMPQVDDRVDLARNLDCIALDVGNGARSSTATRCGRRAAGGACARGTRSRSRA